MDTVDYCLGDGDGSAAIWSAEVNVDTDDDGVFDAIGLDFDADGRLDDALTDLDGNEIMRILGIPAGPQVGQAWQYLKELRLDRGPLEHDEAVDELQKWWNARA